MVVRGVDVDHITQDPFSNHILLCKVSVEADGSFTSEQNKTKQERNKEKSNSTD